MVALRTTNLGIAMVGQAAIRREREKQGPFLSLWSPRKGKKKRQRAESGSVLGDEKAHPAFPYHPTLHDTHLSSETPWSEEAQTRLVSQRTHISKHLPFVSHSLVHFFFSLSVLRKDSIDLYPKASFYIYVVPCLFNLRGVSETPSMSLIRCVVRAACVCTLSDPDGSVEIKRVEWNS